VIDEIPESPEEISPELLSRAFADLHPGAKARSVAIVDAHSGTTGRARLRVEWNDPELPEHVFAKLAPTDPMQREMVVGTGMGKREARFYAELAAEVPVRLARPYASRWNEDGSAYLMLMEDLAAAGCTFPRWSDAEVADHARGLMDSLAALHAHFWQSPILAAHAWIEPPMRAGIGPLLVGSALEQFADERPPAFRELGELYIERVEALSDLLDEGPQTLLHGDSHLGNLFLDGDRVGLLDWACTARAPGLRDVSYFLCSSIPTELRRSEERSLLARYIEGLAKGGVTDAPTLEQAFEVYRLQAVCSWIAATATAAVGSRMQSIEVGQRSMQRATDAILDLETLELLRQTL
jgi:hypothetical protein